MHAARTTRSNRENAVPATLLVLIPLAFFAALPWLKTLGTAVTLTITAATSISVVGLAIYLAERMNRRLDEVELAGQRFAQTRGMTIGMAAAVVAISIPPVMKGLVSLANSMSDNPDRAVQLGIVMGFMLLVVLQTLGSIAASLWWKRRIEGEG